MKWFGQWRSRRRLYLDLYAEMASHVEEKTDALIAAGMAPAQARAAALRAFGHPSRHEERGRAVWRASWLEGLLADVRLAARTLSRSPRLTALIVLTLALGLGATTLIFSVVNAVLLHPLPYRDPGRLVWMTESLPGAPDNNVSWLDMQDWRRQNHVFTDIAGYSDFSLTSNRAASPQLIPTRFVTQGYFPLLGVAPELGRTFLSAEHRLGGPQRLVISHSFWQSWFHGDPAIVGRTIELSHKTWTVVGVMPAGFGAVTHTRLWASFEAYVSESLLTKRQFSFGMYAVARLRHGVGLPQARAEIGEISRRLARTYPTTTGGIAVMSTLTQHTVGAVEPALLLLFGAVALMLLIACANVAGLLLVKTVGRQREIALRLALGASRARLFRQLLAECLLLSAVGAVLGLGLAAWGAGAFRSWLPANTPFLRFIALDLRVWLFALAASLLAALLFASAPACIGLGRGIAGGASPRQLRGGHRRVHAALVVTEVGLATALLIGAGLMARSMLTLLRVAPGFDSHNVIAESVVLDQAFRHTPAQSTAAINRVLGAVERLPGVVSVGAVSLVPFSEHALQPAWDETFIALPGRPPRSDQPLSAHFALASPGYFGAMQIPLVSGRLITPADVAGSLPVAVVDQELARRYWPGSSPVGRQIKLFVQDFNDAARPALTIVGVVGTVKGAGLDVGQSGEVYGPFAQNAAGGMTVVVRSRLAPGAVTPSLAAAIHAAAPGSPIEFTQSLDAMIANSMATRRLLLRLLGPLALGALLLAALGLYGMLSYLVSRATSEIGLRVALGANRPDILRLVAGKGMLPALIGILAGLAAALPLTRLMSSLLFGVRADDPFTFVVVAALLLLAAALACLLPARRAQRITPMDALRCE